MVRTMLCIETSSEYDRAIVRGLLAYSQEHGNCLHLSRVPASVRKASKDGNSIVKWVKEWKADAFIGRWPYNDTLPLASLNCTVVIQNFLPWQTGFSKITGDYIRTGEIAASFFIKRRFSHFAYFGVKGISWSEERGKGFRDIIKFHGLDYQEYLVRKTMASESEQIIQWLKSLPKPSAIFCCNDEYALTISENCSMAKIRVPQDISILGVDNDELICNISDPPLSSIVLDAENGGYELGRMLDEQARSSDKANFITLINPCNIVQRGSTRQIYTKDIAVEKMLEFIDGNFTTITNSKVIFDMAFLCRRAAEIRFKNATGVTVYRYLIEKRLNYLCTLLETTDLSLSECAVRSGFHNMNHLFHLFKKEKGCSPAAWRKSKS